MRGQISGALQLIEIYGLQVPQKELAQIFGLAQATISNFKKQIRANRTIESLRTPDRRRVPRSRLTQPLQERLSAILAANPDVTAAQLAESAELNPDRLSVRTFQRYLRRIGESARRDPPEKRRKLPPVALLDWSRVYFCGEARLQRVPTTQRASKSRDAHSLCVWGLLGPAGGLELQVTDGPVTPEQRAQLLARHVLGKRVFRGATVLGPGLAEIEPSPASRVGLYNVPAALASRNPLARVWEFVQTRLRECGANLEARAEFARHSQDAFRSQECTDLVRECYAALERTETEQKSGRKRRPSTAEGAG